MEKASTHNGSQLDEGAKTGEICCHHKELALDKSAICVCGCGERNAEIGADSNKNSICSSKWVTDEVIQYFHSNLISGFEPIGLDTHSFLIGWYNEKVGPKFQLAYPEDTLAFVVISGPQTFERCIVPYVQSRLHEDPEFYSSNVLDDSMKHAFTIIKSDLKEEGFDVDIFHDFDLHPNRRPKVLVQTAAHVAGAVQYLHKRNLPLSIQSSRFEKKSNLCGVAIHPNYGGWYAIRGVIISNIRVPSTAKAFQKPDPVQLFTDPEKIAQVLENFAYNWQTNEWRNIHEGSGEKYSNQFLEFLSLDTEKRWDFVRKYCAKIKENDSDESEER